LTTLRTAGILDRVAGFIWGTCNGCAPSDPSRSFTLLQVLQQNINVIAFSGLQFGHIGDQFTFLIGIQCEMDADAGTLQMLEPALQD